MKKIFIALLSTFTLIFNHLVCAAVPIPGWYGTFFGGYADVMKNIDVTRDSYYFNNVNYESGFDIGSNFGFKSNPMRYDVEFKYVRTRPKGFLINYTAQTGVRGFSSAMFGFADVYYDLPTIIEPLEPYIGVGIGYGYVDTKLLNDGSVFSTKHKFEDSVFAYQPIVGLTYNFSEFYALYVDYHYVGTSHMDDYGKRYQASLVNAGMVFRLDGKNYK